MVSIGEKLTYLRERLGKTREEAAEEMGVSLRALQSYELNARVPRDEIKVKIARYYRVSIDKLFY